MPLFLRLVPNTVEAAIALALNAFRRQLPQNHRAGSARLLCELRHAVVKARTYANTSSDSCCADRGAAARSGTCQCLLRVAPREADAPSAYCRSLRHVAARLPVHLSTNSQHPQRDADAFSRGCTQARQRSRRPHRNHSKLTYPCKHPLRLTCPSFRRTTRRMAAAASTPHSKASSCWHSSMV